MARRKTEGAGGRPAKAEQVKANTAAELARLLNVAPHEGTPDVGPLGTGISDPIATASGC